MVETKGYKLLAFFLASMPIASEATSTTSSLRGSERQVGPPPPPQQQQRMLPSSKPRSFSSGEYMLRNDHMGSHQMRVRLSQIPCDDSTYLNLSDECYSIELHDNDAITWQYIIAPSIDPSLESGYELQFSEVLSGEDLYKFRLVSPKYCFNSVPADEAMPGVDCFNIGIHASLEAGYGNLSYLYLDENSALRVGLLKPRDSEWKIVSIES